MQIKTEVKATIKQIKQLIAEKYNISNDFDLEIVDETVQVGNFVGKQEEQTKDTPWYPDDSGEWVEVKMGEGKPYELRDNDCIEYLLENERARQDWWSYQELAGDLAFINIVAYKKVR